MIWVDRCGFCKHGAKDDKLPFTCKAFPNGRPRGFRERTGQECNNGYKFEVKKERKAEYNRLFPNWDKPFIPDNTVKYISKDGRVSVEQLENLTILEIRGSKGAKWIYIDKNTAFGDEGELLLSNELEYKLIKKGYFFVV